MEIGVILLSFGRWTKTGQLGETGWQRHGNAYGEGEIRGVFFGSQLAGGPAFFFFLSRCFLSLLSRLVGWLVLVWLAWFGCIISGGVLSLLCFLRHLFMSCMSYMVDKMRQEDL